MVLRVLKHYPTWLALSLIVIFFGCASKPLQYEKVEELSKMEEFDKIVQIKEIPDPQAPPSTESPKVDAKKIPEKTPPPIISEKPKKTKKGKAQKKEGPREPSIEDSEGFVGRRPIKDPFRVGEKVTMMMTYFGVSAGDMVLTTKPFKEVNGRKSYHFHVGLKSSDLFSMFYLVDDWGETFFDYDTLLPASMSIGATESKKLLALKSVLDHTKLKGYRWERAVYKGEEAKERNVVWDILPYSQNTLSAFYYIRAFQLTPGKTYNFHVADDGKNMKVKVEVLRREKIKTLKGEFNTLVLKPTIEIGGIFQPMGNVFFWLTDDDRKMFVRMEAEIKIGKVIGQLRELELGGP